MGKKILVSLIGFVLIGFALYFLWLFIFSGGNENKFIVTKNGEELNIDWKNTCVDIGNNKCFSAYHDDIDFLDENGKCVEKLPTHKLFGEITECSKYKIGDYLVELK